MVGTLLENSMLIIFALFVFGHVAYWVYDNLCYKETSDDWLTGMLMYEVMKKSYKKHPEIIGSKIKVSKDTHYITRDSYGNPMRAERG